MNIEKERIKFEAHASKFFNNKEEAFKVENDQYIYDEIIWMWDCWLKAKKQAIPDGFVVVPIEPTDAMLDASRRRQWDDLSSPYEDMDMLKYKAMIQESQK